MFVDRYFLDVFGVSGVVVAAFVCLWTVNRKIFGYCLYLLAITMIYNTILKNIFQMPLPETCPSTGFGFPSGHMNFISVFYIWVIIHYRNLFLRTALFVVMSYAGFLMVHKGYHYPIDVIFGFLFALTAVLLYIYFTKTVQNHNKITACTILLCLSLAIVVKIMTGAVQPHIYMAFYTLIGTVAGLYIAGNNVSVVRKDRVVHLIFCTLSFAISYLILKNAFLFIAFEEPCLKQLICLMVGFSAVMSAKVADLCIKKIFRSSSLELIVKM